MQAFIDYKPDRDMYYIYMGTTDVALYLGDRQGHKAPHEVLMQAATIGEDRIPWVVIPHESYYALRDAILLRETPHLADKNLLQDMLNDTREVRDRILTMLEES